MKKWGNKNSLISQRGVTYVEGKYLRGAPRNHVKVKGSRNYNKRGKKAMIYSRVRGFTFRVWMLLTMALEKFQKLSLFHILATNNFLNKTLYDNKTKIPDFKIK